MATMVPLKKNLEAQNADFNCGQIVAKVPKNSKIELGAPRLRAGFPLIQIGV
jgi:hypothetical protein